ncbi:MAG: nitroreductase family deazaflavin-dependent oxidoreductase [Actinobacteria bacterium]|nr:nitroreductase family deazaflavin-dependent oxidoreductase [Actinomycetota bacterium]
MDDTTLPYGPISSNLVGPLKRAFRGFNRWCAVPALRAGLGPVVSTGLGGSLLLLRTRGRTSGLLRETPLGYAVLDGRIVVMAGYGPTSGWFRNALAGHEVEVVLPGTVLRGTATQVVDEAARRAAVVALCTSMGVPGLLIGNVRTASPERIDEIAAGLPVLAITPTAVLPGPFEPSGWATTANTVAWVVLPAVLLVRALRRRRRG